MTAELFGKETGYCRGRGGSMHIADIGMGNLGANGIVGAGTPIGTGAALGAKVRGDNNVTAVFTSDGGTNGGTFGECLNLAAIWDLAVIFVIENNHYAVSTPIEKMSRSDDLYKRALGYGVPGEKVDGNDVLAVYSAAKEAVERGRSGKGPTCIECDTYRHQGHHVNDPGTYMPQEKLDYYKQKDPVDRGRKYLTETAGEKAAEEIEESVRKEMEEAVEFAENSPEPDPEQFLKEVKNYE
jgi:pyruvate dehydrogenase E1 component alpha subunit